MNKKQREHKVSKWYSSGFFAATLMVNILELRALQDYFKVVKNFIVTEEKRFCKKIDSAVRKKGLSQEELDSYYEHHQDEFYKWNNSFPNIILSTVLIASCAVFERNLAETCKDLQQNKGMVVTKRLEFIKEQNALNQARIFLSDNFSIFIKDFFAWGKINQYFLIRHCFAHCCGDMELMQRGKVEDLRKAIRKLRTTGVEEDQIGRVKLSSTFIENVISDMMSFWEALESAFKENAIIGPKYWP